jgi:hypothetical protein
MAANHHSDSAARRYGMVENIYNRISHNRDESGGIFSGFLLFVFTLWFVIFFGGD